MTIDSILTILKFALVAIAVLYVYHCGKDRGISESCIILQQNSSIITWKPISEYSRSDNDWVIVKCYDGDFKCIPMIAEMREDGKWYNHGILEDEEIPFEVRYFATLETIDENTEVFNAILSMLHTTWPTKDDIT